MEIIKKYTAIMLSTNNVDDKLIPKFSYGNIVGPHYSKIHPETAFDTEQEAIEHAYKTNKYAKWLIFTTVEFKNL